jgi:ferredoxin-NADP reductase
MRISFERREELAVGIWQYCFTPERTVDFVPGQYVELHISDVIGDPRGMARTFSLTSLPEDSQISFVTKHFGLQSPYKQRLQTLSLGEVARIDDAMGDLVLPKAKDIPLVFVAGGVGIASYVSMLKQLLKRKEERSLFLFYTIRNRRERLFKQITDAYPLVLQDIAIAPNSFTAEQILSSVPPQSLIYLSGSQNFVEQLHSELESLGVQRSQIIFDYFDGYAEL